MATARQDWIVRVVFYLGLLQRARLKRERKNELKEGVPCHNITMVILSMRTLGH
jgi:hypothetical protein